MADSQLPVSGLLHEPTQVTDGRVDLTVDEVYRMEGSGRIDFGGGELEPAEWTPHERYWRHADDDYQWWSLEAGQYLIEYNETLETTEPVVVQPRDALLERGAVHPTLFRESLGPMPVVVGGVGVEIKENARISTVLPRQR